MAEQASEWLERAVEHHNLGELDKAAPLYERVLRLDPGHADALFRLGTLELQRSNLASGAELLRQAALRQPDAAEIQNHLGVACKALGQWGAAAEAFERALKADRQFASAYFNLGDLSETLGETDRAIEFYLQTIKLDLHDPEAFLRLGRLLFARENWTGAEHCFRRVLAIAGVDLGPVAADGETCSSSCGHTHEAPSQHNTSQSAPLQVEAAGAAPSSAILELLSQLGIACLKQEKLDDAAQMFRRILEIDPGLAEMHNNLAFVYERQGKLEEALAEGREAVAVRPNSAEAHNNLGVACRALHRLAEARDAFARAVELRPDFALARFNLGTVDLMRGDYRQGWQGYECRHLTLSTPPRKFAVPRWDGSPLPGKTLLLHAEQGYGDSLQFSRFVAMAKTQSAARVVLEVPEPLLALLAGCPGADLIVGAGTELPPLDAEASLASLPGILAIEASSIPAKVPYVNVPETYRRKWRARMVEMRGAMERQASQQGNHLILAAPIRIGIAWRGNPAQSQDVVRSCPLEQFARLAGVPGIAWFSLQQDATPDELSRFWPKDVSIACLGSELRNFADTAAAMEELDLVISVDTAVAHLAGATGRTCFTLLAHTPDWRWQLDRRDSPWYPTMRLFRQPRWGDWASVIDQVIRELPEVKPVSRGT